MPAQVSLPAPPVAVAGARLPGCWWPEQRHCLACVGLVPSARAALWHRGGPRTLWRWQDSRGARGVRPLRGLAQPHPRPPGPAATPGSPPSHGRSWGPHCWALVRRRLDAPGHLTAGHAPRPPYCRGSQMPLESLSTLPWLAAPLTSSTPVSTFPSLPLLSQPLFPSLPSPFPSHSGPVGPFYR